MADILLVHFVNESLPVMYNEGRGSNIRGVMMNQPRGRCHIVED